jgi:hypothetical protein
MNFMFLPCKKAVDVIFNRYVTASRLIESSRSLNIKKQSKADRGMSSLVELIIIAISTPVPAFILSSMSLLFLQLDRLTLNNKGFKDRPVYIALIKPISPNPTDDSIKTIPLSLSFSVATLFSNNLIS